MLKVGAGLASEYVYNKGYLYSNGWQPMTLTATAALISNSWYPSSASAVLEVSNLSQWTYVVGYVCTWSGTQWKCGCADTTCATNYWQLQAFQSSSIASGGGNSGGSNGSGAGGQWAGSPDANAIVIAPSGSDSNPCTVNSPCQTLERAQSAVRSASIKIVYLRAGTYQRSQTLTLDSNDNGETWMTYPGDAVDSAVIDGGGTINAIIVNGGSNITFSGLQIQNVDQYGIAIHGGTDISYLSPQMTGTGTASGNTIINCIIHDVTNNVPHPNGDSGAIFAVEAVTNTTIKNNVIYNAEGMGIKAGPGLSGTSVGGSNTTIANNVVYNISTGQDDSGGIYWIDSGHGAHTVNVTIINNFVRDWGGQKGIYLDEGSSNVTVTGNVIAPPSARHLPASAAIFYNSGSNNHVSGNIIDVGPTGQGLAAIFLQYTNDNDPMTGNTFEDNTWIANFAGNQNTAEFGISGFTYIFASAGGPMGAPVIRNNTCHNYGGGEERTDGNAFSDSSPIHSTPNLSGWTYTTPPSGGWGPPGYQIPQTGTPPSSPH